MAMAFRVTEYNKLKISLKWAWCSSQKKNCFHPANRGSYSPALKSTSAPKSLLTDLHFVFVILLLKTWSWKLHKNGAYF